MTDSGGKLISGRLPAPKDTDPCVHFCDPTKNPSGFCLPPCLAICPSNCSDSLSSLTPPNSYSDSITFPHPNKPHGLSPLLISMLIILATTFLLAFFYVIYTKFYASRGRGTLNPDDHLHHHDFTDEEQGPPMVDNPIWYITTVGLNPSIINLITVIKYRRSDGVVEGTDCAVCLNEFQDDESLRLLPKCNHAFHIPCIDTWLRSRRNCPICRSPIVSNSGNSAPQRAENSNLRDDSLVGDLINEGNLGRNSTISNTEEDQGQLMRKSERRTVSADFDARPNCQLTEVGEEHGEVGVKGGSSSSSIEKMGVASMKRSVSCGGKFF